MVAGAVRMPITIHLPAFPRQQIEAEGTAPIPDLAPAIASTRETEPAATMMEATVPGDTRPPCAARPEAAAGPAGNTSHCHGDDVSLFFFLISSAPVAV